MNTQEQMDEVLRLSKENNRLLHSLRRRENIALVFKSIYWIFIIGFVFGAYYYLQPLMDIFSGDISYTDEAASRFSFILPQIERIKDYFETLKIY